MLTYCLLWLLATILFSILWGLVLGAARKGSRAGSEKLGGTSTLERSYMPIRKSWKWMVPVAVVLSVGSYTLRQRSYPSWPCARTANRINDASSTGFHCEPKQFPRYTWTGFGDCPDAEGQHLACNHDTMQCACALANCPEGLRSWFDTDNWRAVCLPPCDQRIR